MPKFKTGDVAIVNDEFDDLVPDRYKLLGEKGMVVMVLPDDPERLFFIFDDPTLAGHGPLGSWAMWDHELDKVNV